MHQADFFLDEAGGTGYVVQSILMLAGGVWFLANMAKRFKTLEEGESYCGKYVPEQNYEWMKKIGTAVTVVSALGFFVHWGAIGHMALYLAYGCVGYVARLEALDRLPADSWRAMMVVSSLAIYFVWNNFSIFKENEFGRNKLDAAIHDGVEIDGVAEIPEVSALLHTYIARVCIAEVFVVAASIFHNTHLILHVAQGGLVVMYAVALLTAVYYNIGLHMTEAYFVAEFVTLGLATVVLVAFCFGPPRYKHLLTA